MNMIEYNQMVKRLDEDIERYRVVVETTKEKLTAARNERNRLYHERREE